MFFAKFINRVHPRLHKQFETLFSDGKIGLLPISKVDILHKMKNNNNAENEYIWNFLLRIPYAGRKLEWEVIFDEDYLFAPDFVFDDNWHYAADLPDLDKLESWSNFNYDDHMALQNVLKELLSLLKEYQLKEIEENHSSLFHTIKDIIDNGDPPTEFEVYLNNRHLFLATPLKLNISVLIACCSHDANVEALLDNQAQLAVINIDYNTINHQNSLFKVKLHDGFGELVEPFQKPKLKVDKTNVDLQKWIELSTNYYQELIESYILSVKSRREFLMSIVALQPQTIVEYNAASFRTVSFRAETENLKALVNVDLGKFFPTDDVYVRISLINNLNSDSQRVNCRKSFKVDLSEDDGMMIQRFIQKVNEILKTFESRLSVD